MQAQETDIALTPGLHNFQQSLELWNFLSPY